MSASVPKVANYGLAKYDKTIKPNEVPGLQFLVIELG